MENKDYLEKAEAFWLSEAKSLRADVADIGEGVVALHKRLVALEQGIKDCWVSWDKLRPFARGAPDAAALRKGVDKWKKRQKSIETHGELLGKQAHQAFAIFHSPWSLLAWIPFVRRKIWGQVYKFLSDNDLADISWTWATVLNEQQFRAWLTKRTAFLKKLKQEVAYKVVAWTEWETQSNVYMPAEDAAALVLSEQALQCGLDLQVRTEMFQLAGRYWEGRWLIELKETLEKVADVPKTLTGWSKDNCELRWRRFAKLTPCLVATAYTAPRLFEYFNGDNRSLFNFVDLLIVEEARPGCSAYRRCAVLAGQKGYGCRRHAAD